MDEEVRNATYVLQLGRLLKYQHETNDLRNVVTKSEWRELKRYFRLGNLPDPDGNDAAVDILAIHRRRIEAADPGIRDRIAILVDRIDGWSEGNSA